MKLSAAPLFLLRASATLLIAWVTVALALPSSALADWRLSLIVAPVLVDAMIVAAAVCWLITHRS